MKRQPCIMMHCIISDGEQLKDLLLQKILEVVQKQWPRMNVTLQLYGDYWKYKDSKEVIYGISYDQPITVHDFIKAFPLTWHFTEGMVSDFDTGVEYTSESAVWNKTCNNLESFLHEKVEWVHIYRWHSL